MYAIVECGSKYWLTMLHKLVVVVETALTMEFALSMK